MHSFAMDKGERRLSPSTIETRGRSVSCLGFAHQPRDACEGLLAGLGPNLEAHFFFCISIVDSDPDTGTGSAADEANKPPVQLTVVLVGIPVH